MIEVDLKPVTSVKIDLASTTGSLSLSSSPEIEAMLVRVLVADNAGGGGGVTGFATLTAAGTIQSRHVVRAVAGQALAVDTSVAVHAQQVVGVSVGSAIAGQPVVVQTLGVAEEAGWTWSDGVLFCGPTGALTQSPSATGWLLQLARVISATRIDIDIEQPIAR